MDNLIASITKGDNQTGDQIIIIDQKSVKLLLKMLEFAADKNKKKGTWKKLFKFFYDNTHCY